MEKIETIKQILLNCKELLKKQFKVKNIAVFGSYVKGRPAKKSDIDMLVEFKEPVGLFEFMDMEEYLSKLLGGRVDLVSKKALKPGIGKRILAEAVYI
ncbi:MAG: nucleotidyltransferase family protein [Armatimonadota bacterium]